MLEAALAEELIDHLGYAHGDPAGRGSGNSRNGTTSKTGYVWKIALHQFDIMSQADSNWPEHRRRALSQRR